MVDFDSPWGPPAENVLMALSGRHDVSLIHTFCEEGMGFCGFRKYVLGEPTDMSDDEPEYGEEGEDSLSVITGPAYLIGNLRHYGG